MVYHFEFIKQKNKRYVSWNILFLWGFGLWIALCTTTLFSEENWNSGLAHNILSETETTANLRNVKTTNCTLCSTALQLNTVLRHTCVLMSACLSLVFLCMHEQITKSIRILNNITQNIYSKPVTRDRSNYIFEEKSVTRNSHYILQSKLTIHYELVSHDLQKIFAHKKLEKLVLKGHIVQCGITFNQTAFFFFNNYKIYGHFNNQLFRSTWILMTMISKSGNSKQTKRNSLCLNNDNKYNDDNNNNGTSSFHIQKTLRKRIISSSPEFKKFLANLRCPIMCQCTLEMSASYVIRIKSI